MSLIKLSRANRKRAHNDTKGRTSRLRIQHSRALSAKHEQRNLRHMPTITPQEATRQRTYRRCIDLLLQVGEVDKAIEVLHSFRDSIQ